MLNPYPNPKAKAEVGNLPVAKLQLAHLLALELLGTHPPVQTLQVAHLKALELLAMHLPV